MGAKPHFRRAIHTGSVPPVRISFRLDEVGLAGRRWSTATGMERRRGGCKKVVARTRAFAAFYKLFN